MAGRGSSARPRARTGPLLTLAVLGVLVAVGVAAFVADTRPGYPTAGTPDDVVALTVIPSTIRPGQPFIVTLRTPGDRLADGSEVRWYHAPEVTWQVERDGRWIERYILTMAARGHPPEVLSGKIDIPHPAVPLGPVASTTFEAPEVEAGNYRVCSTVLAEPVVTPGPRSRHLSCASIVVARAIGTTS